MRLPAYHATEIEFTVCSRRFIEEHHRLWEALNEWCVFHDIDPKRVPLISTLRRNVAECRVEYVEFVVDDQGKCIAHDDELVTRPAYSQGEAPPLPFPSPEQVAR